MTGLSDELKPYLERLGRGHMFDEAEAETAFGILMSGLATDAQIGGFLMALRVRGETVPEITGAARAMRARALRVTAPPDAIDTCGTGGDGRGTFNISTAAAFVAAACGLKIAKHGNRNLSSRSGSADLLRELGVAVEASVPVIERSIAEAGIGFMFAPRHHAATRNVANARVQLGTRTIFNALGPLSNPAMVKRQVMGVYDAALVEPLAEVLGRLGSTAAWVVHGDGLDELTTAGSSEIAVLAGGSVTRRRLAPEDVGLPRAAAADLVGGTPAENAAILRDILNGTRGPLRDIVLLNAAAVLTVGGRESDLRAGIALGGEAIDSGAAAGVLDRLIAVTNEVRP